MKKINFSLEGTIYKSKAKWNMADEEVNAIKKKLYTVQNGRNGVLRKSQELARFHSSHIQ